jgi:hypothetical protein
VTQREIIPVKFSSFTFLKDYNKRMYAVRTVYICIGITRPKDGSYPRRKLNFSKRNYNSSVLSSPILFTNTILLAVREVSQE